MRSIISDSRSGRAYWDIAIKQQLPNVYLDNFTDFSDSTCFTCFVACDDFRFTIGTKALSDFLIEGNVARYMKMQISLLAPVICVVFCMYEKSPTALNLSGEPFTQSQHDVYSAIMKFSKDNKLEIKKWVSLPTYPQLFLEQVKVFIIIFLRKTNRTHMKTSVTAGSYIVEQFISRGLSGNRRPSVFVFCNWPSARIC